MITWKRKLLEEQIGVNRQALSILTMRFWQRKNRGTNSTTIKPMDRLVPVS
jgi:hypothetical protein